MLCVGMKITPPAPWDQNSKDVSIVSKAAVLQLRVNTTRGGIFVSPVLFCLRVFTPIQATDNLRYAFNSCIFGSTNATDTLSTPCSSSTVCGPLQKSLGDGMGTPLTSSQYSYCSSYDNSFLGSSLEICQDCLKVGSNTVYLTNCMSRRSCFPKIFVDQNSPHCSSGRLLTKTNYWHPCGVEQHCIQQGPNHHHISSNDVNIYQAQGSIRGCHHRHRCGLRGTLPCTDRYGHCLHAKTPQRTPSSPNSKSPP